MTKIVLQPTSTAEWKELITQAQAQSTHELDENLESYLIFLLMRFTNSPEIANSLLAIDYFEAYQEVGTSRRAGLQEVGDKCLLLSGLFPGQARKKLVEPRYFVQLGQTAYSELSELERQSLSELYDGLSCEFVHLMEVLQATRTVSGNKVEECIDPLAAFDLLTLSGSKAAKERLQKHTQESDIIALDIDSTHLH